MLTNLQKCENFLFFTRATLKKNVLVTFTSRQQRNVLQLTDIKSSVGKIAETRPL